ncbi:phospholipid carrier-dependent glycosyltransferase [Stakelama flava]|uniref:phospholipid carrier-dependent glycosyltransferase n=1 Tax=Stakelama flava TaxID=2860338 RepID=UPI001FE4FEA1|nr:phospholipid carrier-dependent glycosyltransferase [Stakelama flava]
MREHPFLTALLLGLAAQILFLINLGHPAKLMFDEVHYVPAARVLLTLDHAVNQEHPLLAKEIIAAGIALFGDNPIGWRLFSAIAGAATVSGVFAILWQLCRDWRAGVLGAVLAIVNQMIFVQARIGMLDGFLGMFVVLAIAAMLWAMRGPARSVPGRLIVTAVLLGLGVAVKWTAVPYVAFAGMTLLFVRMRDARVAGRPLTTALGDAGQRHWAGIGVVPALLILGLVSITVYFATFLPAFFYAHDALTLRKLIPYQFDMWALQTQVLPAHPYQSDWWGWPIIARPIWYFYEPDMGVWRGVLLIGNPVVMWGGLIGVAACLIGWWRTRSGEALGAAGLWIGSLAIWAIIPKSLGFYYYYYLSSIFLCVALPVSCRLYARGRWRHAGWWYALAAIAMFAYFYPIIAAMPLTGQQSFTHWTWFVAWR